ncbi:MAG: enoyl-CoA hydratase/isomerase family protein [Desulfobacterium sp.]|nr:enoyl-CoA hydratase/isomerase family protein [Desulfobacterium sp.]
MEYQTIQIQETEDKIGVITLNRPEKRNALSIQMRNEISDCLKNWEGSDRIGVVIFTGAGGMFSAGFDLKEFSQPAALHDVYTSSAAYHRIIWKYQKPTIAAVSGPALGGAFDLSTLCDIRICSQSAIFGHPEIKFGAPPLFTPLRWIIGSGLASELCLTGRRIDAAEAYRIGLVSEVIADEGDLLHKAISIGRTILEAPIETLKYVKGYLAGNLGKNFEDSFCIEHDKPFQEMISKMS